MNARALMKRLREERRGGVTEDGPRTTAVAKGSWAPPPPSHDGMDNPTANGDDNTDAASQDQLIERAVDIQCRSLGISRQLTLLEDPTGSLAGGNGATLWDSSLALTNFLTYHYADTDLSDKHVLELGAGVGLVGMALASMGANVVVTERDMALPLLRRNMDRNAKVTGGRVEVSELSWGGEAMQKLIKARGDTPFDIVVGSDLIFPSNSDAYEALADAYEVILKRQTCTPDRGDCVAVDIWLSHEPRTPAIEDGFFQATKERGILVRRMEHGDGIDDDKETKRLPVDLLPEDIFIYQLALDV